MAYIAARNYLNQKDDAQFTWTSNSIASHTASNATIANSFAGSSNYLTQVGVKATAASNVAYAASNNYASTLAQSIFSSNAAVSASNLAASNNTKVAAMSNAYYILEVPTFPVGNLIYSAFSNNAPAKYVYSHAQTTDSNTYPLLWATYSNAGVVASNDLYTLPTAVAAASNYAFIKFE